MSSPVPDPDYPVPDWKGAEPNPVAIRSSHGRFRLPCVSTVPATKASIDLWRPRHPPPHIIGADCDTAQLDDSDRAPAGPRHAARVRGVRIAISSETVPTVRFTVVEFSVDHEV